MRLALRLRWLAMAGAECGNVGGSSAGASFASPGEEQHGAIAAHANPCHAMPCASQTRPLSSPPLQGGFPAQ